jgi:hypothetical protein
MIRYEEFCRIRQGYDQEHLSVSQLAAELGLNVKTVAHWMARKAYQPRQRVVVVDVHLGRRSAPSPF